MSERTSLRLLVVKVLVLSLFGTLFTRLWYVQVVSGDDYQAQAQQNAVRDIVVQPPRGLIVDDMGRPLAVNRSAWVVTIDRTVLGKLSKARAKALLHRVADVTHRRYAHVLARTKLCGEPGAKPPPLCWNGSPYQPVPIAEDVPEQVALAIQEQAEDFPGVLAESRKVRAYPSPYGVNAAHVLGYISPITDDELRQAERSGDRTATPISLVGRSGLEAEYDRYLRGTPGERAVSVDSMGRVLGNAGFKRPQPGHSLVTSIDAKLQGVVERQLVKTIRTARRTLDPVTGRKYEADSGAVVVMDATNGRVLALTSYPSYDPDVWVGGISSADLTRLYSKQAGTPLLSRVTQGQFAPGSTFKPITAAAALSSGYSTTDRLNCSSSLTVGDRVFQNYESAAYGFLTFAEALQLSCDTFFYRIAYANWLRSGADSGDVNAKDPIVDTAKGFGFGQETGIDLPGRPAAGSPTGAGSGRTGGATRTTTAGSGSSRVMTTCTSLPGSSARTAGATAPATPSTSRSARATRSSPPYSWRLRTPRCPTAARCGSPGWRRQSSPLTGRCCAASRRAAPAGSRSPKAPCATSTGHCSVRRRSARWRGGSSASPSTRCRSDPRPAPPRCTASRQRRGSPATTSATSWS